MRRIWRYRPYEPTQADIERFDSTIGAYLGWVRDEVSDRALTGLINKIGPHSDRDQVRIHFDAPIPEVELRGREALDILRSRLTGAKR